MHPTPDQICVRFWCPHSLSLWNDVYCYNNSTDALETIFIFSPKTSTRQKSELRGVMRERKKRRKKEKWLSIVYTHVHICIDNPPRLRVASFWKNWKKLFTVMSFTQDYSLPERVKIFLKNFQQAFSNNEGFGTYTHHSLSLFFKEEVTIKKRRRQNFVNTTWTISRRSQMNSSRNHPGLLLQSSQERFLRLHRTRCSLRCTRSFTFDIFIGEILRTWRSTRVSIPG